VEFLNVHFLFQVNWMNLRDADSGKILWQGSDDLSQPGKKIFPHTYVQPGCQTFLGAIYQNGKK
jgi:hypothetical protein